VLDCRFIEGFGKPCSLLVAWCLWPGACCLQQQEGPLALSSMTVFRPHVIEESSGLGSTVNRSHDLPDPEQQREPDGQPDDQQLDDDQIRTTTRALRRHWLSGSRAESKRRASTKRRGESTRVEQHLSHTELEEFEAIRRKVSADVHLLLSSDTIKPMPLVSELSRLSAPVSPRMHYVLP
jgi:hypothetical protein